MFDSCDQQLGELEKACASFMDLMTDLASEKFLVSLGDWTARDIAAHFIGWNRITLVGCSELREGVEPFYFYDGTNDYRRINAKFFAQFPSTDKNQLLKEITSTKDALISYLKTIPEHEWDLDTGVVHYRGDPATVARCVDSLIRDYGKHGQEIVNFLKK